MRRLLPTALVVALPALLPAQGTATLRGVVWDSVSNRPLAAARIELVDVANPSAPILRADSRALCVARARIRLPRSPGCSPMRPRSGRWAAMSWCAGPIS